MLNFPTLFVSVRVVNSPVRDDRKYSTILELRLNEIVLSFLRPMLELQSNIFFFFSF